MSMRLLREENHPTCGVLLLFLDTTPYYLCLSFSPPALFNPATNVELCERDQVSASLIVAPLDAPFDTKRYSIVASEMLQYSCSKKPCNSGLYGYEGC